MKSIEKSISEFDSIKQQGFVNATENINEFIICVELKSQGKLY